MKKVPEPDGFIHKLYKTERSNINFTQTLSDIRLVEKKHYFPAHFMKSSDFIPTFLFHGNILI